MAKNNAHPTAEDSVSPVRKTKIQKGSMRIESANRRLATDGEYTQHFRQTFAGAANSYNQKKTATVYTLGENHGTFTGLYQGDLSAAQYQRRIGTQDVNQMQHLLPPHERYG